MPCAALFYKQLNNIMDILHFVYLSNWRAYLLFLAYNTPQSCYCFINDIRTGETKPITRGNLFPDPASGDVFGGGNYGNAFYTDFEPVFST